MEEFDNAVLVEIATPGPLDAYGDPGTPVPVWTGRAGGYLKRIRKTVLSGGASVRVATDVFTILDSHAAPILVEAGPDWTASSVVIEDRRTAMSVTRRFRVNAFEHRAAGTEVDSCRLELEGETDA
jgi:hypothetical protein